MLRGTVGLGIVVVVCGCGDTGVGPDPTGTGGHGSTSPDSTTGQGGASSSTDAATTTTGQGGSTSSTGVGGSATSSSGTGGDGTGGNGQTMMGGWWESGTRLKAQSYVGSDGSTVPGPVRDTMLNADCFYARAADGQTRCVPNGAAIVGLYYKDASCTQAVAFATCTAANGYVSQSVPNGCAPEIHIYPLQTTYTGALYMKSGTNCNSATALAGYTYFNVGSELAASSFVAGTLTVEP